MYSLEYLPSAKKDMVEIAAYISRKLKDPLAADKIALKLIEAGEELRRFPYSAPVYIPLKPLKQEYRRQSVENYMIFYWVSEAEKKITVARVVYSRRDYRFMLE